VYGNIKDRTPEQSAAVCQLMRVSKQVRRLSTTICVQHDENRSLKAGSDKGEEPCMQWRLDVAFGEDAITVTALAKQHGKSRREVRRAIQSSAQAWMDMNLLHLAHLENSLLEPDVEVEVFFDACKWDGSRQTFSLPFHEDLSVKQSVAGGLPSKYHDMCLVRLSIPRKSQS
jgi:hypothetical protein